MNKSFLLNSEKNFRADPSSCRFREKRIPNSEKNDITELKARLLQ